MHPTGCDNIVATSSVTADGSVLFAKNSDRHPDECQHLRRFPAADAVEGSELRCQYRTVPQVRHTYAMLGSEPFWLWGFEHGVNERGVAIGNEAIWMNGPDERTGLLGMDLIRLGLERGGSAREALEVITRLLETCGQGGSARFWDPAAPGYHNSFVIADVREAWVLETSGRDWVARKVRGATSISNYPTTGKEFDLASASVRARKDVDFARDYCDIEKRPHAAGKARYERSQALLKQHEGKFTVPDMFRMLRDHGGRSDWKPGKPEDHTLCMHPGGGASVAGMVAHLHPDGVTVWCSLVTPCVSPFLPFFVDVAVPDVYAVGTNEPRPESLWWRFKRLLESVSADWPARYPRVRTCWDEFESELLDAAPGHVSAPLETRSLWVRKNVLEMLRRLDRLERELCGKR